MVQIHSKSFAPAAPVAPRGRILLVDDDPGLLRLLSIRLRAEHYDVEAVESAAEALAALSRFRPDLVVTDLRMDNMDGIQLLKEIQRQRPGLCVLLLTAHGTIPDAVEATQSGAFGFLTKPVDKQQLLEYVERAMKVSGMPKSTDEWSAEIITRSRAFSRSTRVTRVPCSGATAAVPGAALAWGGMRNSISGPCQPNVTRSPERSLRSRTRSPSTNVPFRLSRSRTNQPSSFRPMIAWRADTARSCSGSKHTSTPIWRPTTASAAIVTV